MSVRSGLDGLVHAMQNYPDDLVVSIQNNHLTTNYNRPYLMWLQNRDKQRLLLVIDETGHPDKIRDYGALTLLTARNITVIDPRSDRTITFPYKDITMTITKESMTSLTQKLYNLIKLGSLIALLIGLFVLPLLVLMANLGYALLIALVIFLLGKLFFPQEIARRVELRRTIQIAFHSLTLPLLITAIIGLLGLHSTAVPSLMLGLYVVLTGLNLHSAYRVPGAKN